MTLWRKEKVARSERFMKALSFGRLLGYDGTAGYVRMNKSFSRVRPILPEIVLSSMLILWSLALLITEGARGESSRS